MVPTHIGEMLTSHLGLQSPQVWPQLLLWLHPFHSLLPNDVSATSLLLLCLLDELLYMLILLPGALRPALPPPPFAEKHTVVTNAGLGTSWLGLKS